MEILSTVIMAQSPYKVDHKQFNDVNKEKMATFACFFLTLLTPKTCIASLRIDILKITRMLISHLDEKIVLGICQYFHLKTKRSCGAQGIKEI